MRDKNYIKVLKPRPLCLINYWRQPGSNHTVSNSTDFDIKGIIIGSNPKGTSSNLQEQSVLDLAVAQLEQPTFAPAYHAL